ncbi:MAG: aspartate dehydrogenase domain-containing protein [Alkalispirochaeta sp.]|jgi:aspartate dehydrogenase
MVVGFLGFGTISRTILHEIERRGTPNISFWGYYNRSVPTPPKSNTPLHRATTVDELIASECSIVVEAAGHEAVHEHVPAILRSGKDVLSLSVGAYLDPEFLAHIRAICALPEAGTLHIPSGALPGADVIQAAGLRPIESVELVTRKPVNALADSSLPDGSPPDGSLAGGSPDAGQNRTTLFEGSAEEAVKRFPKNINLSAALSLIGVGGQRTRVTIVADPSVQRNVHRVTVRGEFGEFSGEISSVPSSNPRTSLIAPLSAAALLIKLAGGIRIGT